MKQSKPVFRGAATALITPMNDDGIDYESFGRLIDWQIEQGVDALVALGTTGESAVLSDEERFRALEFAVERTAGRVPLIAGTGSNDTAHAVRLSRFACGVGADAVLTVTPYYNKTTQTGLVRHFNVLADSVTIPLILYNVPSRTGVSIEPKTYVELAKHPNIAAVKEASGNIAAITETFSLAGGTLDIYSGNDDQIVPLLAMGGLGVISVLSNVLPAKTAELCRRFFDGDVQGSAALQCALMPLIKALFSQVNPVPVKAAMAAMGRCSETLRLPLCPLEEPHRARLMDCMKTMGLLA